MNSEFKMTMKQYLAFEKEVKNVFNIVRVLDENLINQVTADECGNMAIHPCECYAFWGKNQRCENCISAKVLMDGCQRTKLEILDGKIYQVFSKYAEIDGKPCAIEMLSLMEENALIDSHGREELIQMLSDYKKELYTDALTGCYNRRYYEECLKDKDFAAGVAMFDLDGFKYVNDTFGHDAGDLSLKAFVETTTHSIRKTDMLIRMGGDEFLLVLPGTSPDSLFAVLDKIRKKIYETKVLGYHSLQLSASIGAVMTKDNETIETALRYADEAMYAAKQEKNKVCVDHRA